MGKGKGTLGGKFAPPLVSSFDSALRPAHREEMAKPARPRFYAQASTMTSNNPDKLEFETMSAYNEVYTIFLYFHSTHSFYPHVSLSTVICDL